MATTTEEYRTKWFKEHPDLARQICLAILHQVIVERRMWPLKANYKY